MRKSTSGFTIVELLIVIVVIAILAAISIMAYNGLQARAENTKTIQGVAAYVKAAKAYAAVNGSLPKTTTYVCLGEASSSCATVPSGTCAGIGSVSGDQSFVDAIKTQVTNLPGLSDRPILCSGGMSYKGGIYHSGDGQNALIWYFLSGDVDCSVPAGMTLSSRSVAGSATRCFVLATK